MRSDLFRTIFQWLKKRMNFLSESFVPFHLMPFLIPQKLPKHTWQGLVKHYPTTTWSDGQGNFKKYVRILDSDGKEIVYQYELDGCKRIAALRQTNRNAAANFNVAMYMQKAAIRALAQKHFDLL